MPDYSQYSPEEIEDIENSVDLEMILDVNEDSVVLNLNDDQIHFSDSELDYYFENPHVFYEQLSEENADFWTTMITEMFRVRQKKRTLYSEMGFSI